MICLQGSSNPWMACQAFPNISVCICWCHDNSFFFCLTHWLFMRLKEAYSTYPYLLLCRTTDSYGLMAINAYLKWGSNAHDKTKCFIWSNTMKLIEWSSAYQNIASIKLRLTWGLLENKSLPLLYQQCTQFKRLCSM